MGPIENARLERVKDRVNVQTAAMRELPFKDASFDIARLDSRAGIVQFVPFIDRAREARSGAALK